MPRRDQTRDEASGPTRQTIIEAALKTLRESGFARASARAIARAGSFNQALIFYHFGTVNSLLLAALDRTSTARMARYRDVVKEAESLAELVTVARRTYQEDRDAGHMTVVAEMVAGGVSHPALRSEIAARIRVWAGFVEEVLDPFLRDSPLGALVPARDAGFALVAFYLGLNISSRIEDEQEWVDNVFEAAERTSTVLAAFL